jgi:hypothetical protein
VAGDWIKFRLELYTNPRFLALCDWLVTSDNPGLLEYIVAPESNSYFALPPSNETVTDVLLRCVTWRVTRDVTMCALLRVWSCVNTHGRTADEHDAVCPHMAISNIDDVSGIQGFGEAMKSVGWVTQVDGGLVFPNFLEFNRLACQRKESMTGAERQRLYRERKKQAANSPEEGRNESVTTSNENPSYLYKSSFKNSSKKEKKAKAPRADAGRACSLDEVREFFLDKGTTVSPEEFWAYYEANGWRQSNGNRIKNWRACLTTWEARETKNGKIPAMKIREDF